MPTTWTKITKASGDSYTYVNPAGKEQYDEPTILYDDSTVGYDGTPATYTKITKASGTAYTNVPKAT